MNIVLESSDSYHIVQSKSKASKQTISFSLQGSWEHLEAYVFTER